MDTSETVTVTRAGDRQADHRDLGEHETRSTPGSLSELFTAGAARLTIIRVHYNVGFGNNIAIRGDEYR